MKETGHGLRPSDDNGLDLGLFLGACLTNTLSPAIEV
jgi:hypothetical protein